MKRWQKVTSHNSFKCSIFNVRSERRSSQTKGEHEFFIIEAADWVNIIALTTDQQVVLVRQFRHGTEEMTIEIPGGMIDPGEEPLQAAMRELYEETGYTSESWTKLGINHPNPAIQKNLCYTFLAENASLTGSQTLDSTEEIEVFTTQLHQIPDMIKSGSITHALVITAFYFLTQHR